MKSAEVAKERLIAIIHTDRMNAEPRTITKKLEGGSVLSMVMRPVTYTKLNAWDKRYE